MSEFGDGTLYQVGRDTLYGLCDPQGREILRPEWTRLVPDRKFGIHLIRSADSCGYADLLGKILVPAQFARLETNAPDSLNLTDTEDNRFTYVFATGKLEPRNAPPEEDVGMGGVAMGGHGGDDSPTDQTHRTFERHLHMGRPVAVRMQTRRLYRNGISKTIESFDTLKLAADDIWPLNDSCRSFFFAVRRKDKWGIVDSAGKTLLPFAYDSILPRIQNNNGFCTEYDLGNGIPVRVGRKHGIVDLSGKTLVPFEADSITQPFQPELFFLHRNGLTGVQSRDVRFAPLLGARELPRGVWGIMGYRMLSVFSPEDDFLGYVGPGGRRYYKD